VTCYTDLQNETSRLKLSYNAVNMCCDQCLTSMVTD